MKRTVITAIIAASFIAPTSTLAQSVALDFPTFYPEFSEQKATHIAKRKISTESKAVVTPIKANTQK